MLVGDQNTVDVLWANPAHLARIPSTNQAGARIARVARVARVARIAYTLDGRTFRAIRVQTNTGTPANPAWTQSTYDLKTGLLLIQSQAVQIPSGGTGIAFVRLTSGKQVTLPGFNASWPNALRALKSYPWLAKGLAGVTGAGGVQGQATINWVNLKWSPHLLSLGVLANNKPYGSLQYVAGAFESPWMSPGSPFRERRSRNREATPGLRGETA